MSTEVEHPAAPTEEIRPAPSIEYAVAEGKKTKYAMQFFGATLGFQDRWAATRVRTFCDLCKGEGVITVSDEQGTRVRVCSHGQPAQSSEGTN